MLLTLIYVLFIVVGLRFFEPQVVGLLLLSLAAPWTLYELIKNRFKSVWVPLAAAVVGSLVWYLDSVVVFKILPVLITSLFFVKFAEAVIFKRPFLAKMVQKTPKMIWSDEKLAFIDSSHLYWLLITTINLVLQVAVLFASMKIWALYTTVGWYLLFGGALALQIIYEKVRGVK
ncbi:MAG: hypothetical protein PF439_07420 [Helicobacteraceae bacterium]|jgi:hypothetical protein|nr:hypothetical protein [Helicobacteraceae bacterium]